MLNASRPDAVSANSEPRQANWSNPQKFLEKATQLSGFKSPPKIYNVNEFDEKLTVGQRVADGVAATIGSWRFIIIQSSVLLTWILLNIFLPDNFHWDPYPFILLNLALSFQAAYAAPFIMMSQNRQASKDRLSAENDYDVNKLGEVEIQAVLLHLEEQDRLLLELMERFDRAFGSLHVEDNGLAAIEETVVSHGMMVMGGKQLEYEHCEKVKDDLLNAVVPYLDQAELDSGLVRDVLGHCYAIVNIESFQRNALVDINYVMDENKLNVLRILYKEAFISIGADYDKPDAEDLNEVRDLLLKRMKARALDPRLIERFAEVSRTLICKVAGANC